MPDRPRVRVVTLGCKVNQAESDDIAARLESHGVAVDARDDADVVVINTCTVTGEADHKARKAIRHALAAPSSPHVVVTGCLAAIDPAGLAALGERVVVEADKDLVTHAIAALLPEGESGIAVPPDRAYGRRTRSRVQVKVQDGCDTFCTYCIVPDARGVPRSVSAADVTAEVAALVDAGVAEVVLTGINIGRYRDGERDLADLVVSVAKTGVSRIRLSSIEPGDVDARLLGVLRDTRSFCRHLHVPLQSGSNRTLSAMGRPYDTATYSAVVEAAREALPGVAVTTDIMVGFPGETDADAEESHAFVRAVGFARLHVFRFSSRAGTPAATMPDQVTAALKAGRASAMRALGDELAATHARAHIGRRLEVLVERCANPDAQAEQIAEGTSREYLRVRIPGCAATPGAVVVARAERLDPDGVLVGRVADGPRSCG